VRRMPKKLRVVLYGVGEIGQRIARLLLAREGVEIVGALDAAEDKVGRDLGEVLGMGGRLGVTVSDDPDAVFSGAGADVAVHATTSRLRDAYPQIAKAMEHGVSVVSTCEELAYPYVVDARLAGELDGLAKRRGVAVLGTGINPGFLMDALVITLTAVCQEVERIRVIRVIDAATRRAPFQRKIGAGLTVEDFRKSMQRGEITGHVGLTQSIAMIAAALGWELDGIEADPAEPVVTARRVRSEFVTAEPGRVAGLRQCARGLKGGAEAITLVFEAYMGAGEERDSILIEGTPSIRQEIVPCVQGDLGTAAIVVNSIPKVLNAPPGLKTMKDLPLPSAALGDMRRYVK